METFVLDGAMMPDKKSAHAYLAATLRLPSWYGANLDALADCLGELGQGKIIILQNASAINANLGDYGNRLISTFSELSDASGAFGFKLH